MIEAWLAYKLEWTIGIIAVAMAGLVLLVTWLRTRKIKKEE